MTEFPDVPSLIADDTQVIAIARECGVFDKIVARSTLAHSVTGLVHTSHETHWLLFSLFTGMADASDNGWTLAAYPKRTHSLAQVNAALRAAVDASEPEFLL